MKKVYQRIIDPKKGDCFKCCIASILELDYDEVPNFVEQEDWFGAAIDFCKEHGYDFAYREYFNPNLNYLENPTCGCFKPWNLDGTYHLDKLGREEGIDGLFLAGVYSPRYTNAGDIRCSTFIALLSTRTAISYLTRRRSTRGFLNIRTADSLVSTASGMLW